MPRYSIEFVTVITSIAEVEGDDYYKISQCAETMCDGITETHKQTCPQDGKTTIGTRVNSIMSPERRERPNVAEDMP